MLTADTQFDVRAGLLAELSSHLNQLANAILIQLLERIGLVDLLAVVFIQELASIVSGEAERHLREVVRAEGEELSFFRNLISRDSGSRNLDHRADM